MKRQWTKEEAFAWYHSHGWLRGCNFIGSDCANRRDMWQKYQSKEHLETAGRELSACRDLGFNTVRLIVEFDVWQQEHDDFMDILEAYISLCDKYGQSVMLVLTSEAELCRGEFRLKPLGPQTYALGYHQGRFPLTPEQKALPPIHPLETEYRDAYLQMVSEIVGRYRADKRILYWNVYNEPGIVLGERAVPLLDLMFECIRAQDPIQPLCGDWWRGTQNGTAKTRAEQHALELSDVISWHSYKPLEELVPEYEILRAVGRPVLLTEWLNRINHSEIRELYPLLYLENIACWCWGFVAGKTQTYEPWDTLWEQYDAGTGSRYDFTRWQHDLLRPNLRPYDPAEIKLIKTYNRLAEQAGR